MCSASSDHSHALRRLPRPGVGRLADRSARRHSLRILTTLVAFSLGFRGFYKFYGFMGFKGCSGVGVLGFSGLRFHGFMGLRDLGFTGLGVYGLRR